LLDFLHSGHLQKRWSYLPIGLVSENSTLLKAAVIHIAGFYCLVKRFYTFSIQADHQAVQRGTGKFGERLEKAAEMLMGCFRVCASDK